MKYQCPSCERVHGFIGALIGFCEHSFCEDCRLRVEECSYCELGVTQTPV